MQNQTNQKEFYVERILSKRDYPLQYLIKWEGWDVKDATWEPVENLEHVLELVDEFEKKEAIKKYEKESKMESMIKKNKQTIAKKFDELKEVTPPREKTFSNAKEREEQKIYKEYKTNKMKKEKEKEKKDNILQKFPNDEEAECIKTVKLIKDTIHCLVSWKTKSNGIKSEDAFISTVILSDKIPLLLIDYYESKIKFI